MTPPESSQHIYDAIPHEKKTLWYIEGFGHCKADGLWKKNILMEFINLLMPMSNQKNKSFKRPKGLFFL